jgi:hypothetical protein
VIQTSPPGAEHEAEHPVDRELRLFQSEFKAEIDRIKRKKGGDLSESDIWKYRGICLIRRTAILRSYNVPVRCYPFQPALWDALGLPPLRRGRRPQDKT